MTARHKLASMLSSTNPEEAEALFRENEAAIRKKYAPELPLFKTRMNEVAKSFGRLGKADDEKRILKELEKLQQKPNNS
jgi:hypothetical protein